MPTVAANPVGAAGGLVGGPDAITNNVMLCAGTVVLIALLTMAASAKCEIEVWVAELICQTCAVPGFVKFARLTVTDAALVYLLMTITVSALSEVRWAANAERLSGLATVVDTLVSPKVERLPS